MFRDKRSKRFLNRTTSFAVLAVIATGVCTAVGIQNANAAPAPCAMGIDTKYNGKPYTKGICTVDLYIRDSKGRGAHLLASPKTGARPVDILRAPIASFVCGTQ